MNGRLHACRYLIVGGGLTADAACRGVRARDPDGSIVLVTPETFPPYARPPLTKGLWKGDEEDSIWCGTGDLGVDLRLGRTVVSLDVHSHQALDDSGETYGYERLLLATGGHPRRLPFGGDEVIYFRTLGDYRRLRGLTDGSDRCVVIGGGFIGSEIAAALALNGLSVTMVFPEAGIGARVFPTGLSRFVTDYFREKGIEVLAGAEVNAIEPGDGGTRISLGDGRTTQADMIVAGLGIDPAVELAIAAGLPVDDGIIVDDHARVDGHDDVFAAGDVARFPAAALATTLRVEHEDHAKSQGRLAGSNMAGADEAYDHLPFFYSDLFDLGYEAVGEVDARHDTVESWNVPNREGIVAYVDAQRRPRGFLFWNVWDKIDRGRERIRSGESIGPELRF
jgi:NADPH-dependent 2,4-dienoyl-CoA reductase/sulfur reductase-like enzyme